MQEVAVRKWSRWRFRAKAHVPDYWIALRREVNSYLIEASSLWATRQ